MERQEDKKTNCDSRNGRKPDSPLSRLCGTKKIKPTVVRQKIPPSLSPREAEGKSTTSDKVLLQRVQERRLADDSITDDYAQIIRDYWMSTPSDIVRIRRLLERIDGRIESFINDAYLTEEDSE